MVPLRWTKQSKHGMELPDRRERRHAGASAAVAAVVTAICINMVLDAALCGSRATVSLCVGWVVGNEEGFIEWRARRAGDDFFGPLDFGAGSPGPHEMRPLWGPWRPTSELKPCGCLNQCIWERWLWGREVGRR